MEPLRASGLKHSHQEAAWSAFVPEEQGLGILEELQKVEEQKIAAVAATGHCIQGRRRNHDVAVVRVVEHSHLMVVLADSVAVDSIDQQIVVLVAAEEHTGAALL